MAHPQHHAETEILRDDELAGVAIDQLTHLPDLARERRLIEHPVGHISIEGIEGAKSIAGIRAAQILRHLPENAAAPQHKRIVDLMHELNAFAAIVGYMPRQHREGVEPHGEIVEILPVPACLLANANSALAPEHAVDLRDYPLRLIDEFVATGSLVQRGEQNDAERVGDIVDFAARHSTAPDGRLS